MILRSLKARLGLGAGLIAVVAVLASTLAIFGSTLLSARIDDALGAQARIEGFSSLAAQISGFAVLAVEAEASGADAGEQAARLTAQAEQVRATFELLTQEVARSVERARSLGIDEQSRRATVSIGLARMRALFDDIAAAVARDGGQGALRARLDGFSTRFSPLLTDAIGEENRIRTRAVADIDVLRGRLIRAASVVGIAAVGLFAVFYLALLRPLLARLDLLTGAAQRIADADFAVALPVGRGDEVDQVLAETNRLADTLARRQAGVDADRARLNEIIDTRTRDLQHANARLARIDGDRQRFFADFSHELRTPLTVILMEAELGLKSGAAGEAFSVIHTRARKLNRRIDDLLRLARSKTGQLALETRAFDLAEAARDALDDCARLADRADMTRQLDAPATVPVVGDPDWTRQVISGLIENAIRHAASGGRVAVVVTRDASDGSDDAARGTVAVIDNGPGVAAGADVFQRFAQAQAATRHEGFGIGLALTRWAMEAQAGEVTLTSPVPASRALGTAPGTVVQIALPLAAAGQGALVTDIDPAGAIASRTAARTGPGSDPAQERQTASAPSRKDTA